MIYLSISVSAVGTFGNLGYIYTSASLTDTSSRAWQSITLKSNTDQEINLTSGSFTTGYIWNAYKTNQIIQDGYIIVVTIKLYNVQTAGIEFLGAGQLGSGTIPTSNTTAVKLNALDLNQEIIATTISEDGAYVRLTVTFKASGFVNQYPVCLWKIKKKGNLNAVEYCNAELYETIEEAAGSGVTPEEMREVLSSWGEEELLPGIEDSVQSGVAAGMEEALADEKNQASSGAQSGLDELAGALSGVTDDITQAKQSFETLGSALSYSGTTASLTFPAMTVPFLGTISDAQPINLTQQIDNIMPPTLLLIIRCALSIGIVSYPIFELIHQLRKLLDKG